MSYHVTYTPRDREGNAGPSRIVGIRPTLEEAQSIGSADASYRHPGADLSWRQYNDGSRPGPVATWGLMAGGLNTYVTISETPS